MNGALVISMIILIITGIEFKMAYETKQVRRKASTD